MFTRYHARVAIMAGLMFVSATVAAQEFPIAAGRDSTFVGGGAFGGTHFLIAILGDTANSTSVTAQLVSTSGSLIGSRISVGMLAAPGGVIPVAFDGTDFLMVWSNPDDTVYGQFISSSGSLVRSPFVIATNASISGRGGCLAFGDSTYMVVWTRNSLHYGQRVSTSGNLIGAPTQISSASARDNCIAFDGTNYLVAWCEHVNNELVYGQFISASGSLVGSNFVIDDSPYRSDNPVTIAFDGSRYLVCYHDQAGPNTIKWNLFCRFVTPSGVVSTPITIRDSTYNPVFAISAFDGTNYLITWTEGQAFSRGQSKGRFYNTTGTPLDTAFALFDTLGGKVPLATPPLYGGNHYLIVTTRVRLQVDPGTGDIHFTDGDVYGMILPSSTTGVKEDHAPLTPGVISLSQNYPNPFNPSTTISYTLAKAGRVNLTVYDVLGRQVASLVNGAQQPGMHSVTWRAAKMASGVYFYRLRVGAIQETKKLLLQK